MRLAVGSRRVPGRSRRIYGVAAGAAVLLVVANVLEVVGTPVVWVAGALAFPAAAVFAVGWSGLYDIDLIVHRTLLYGLVTVGLLVLYSGIVAGLAGLVPGAAAAAATAAAVVAVHPLSQLIHRRIDRFVYGERRDPYQVMVRLGTRIELAPGPAQVLPTIIQTVGEALRVPSVGLFLAGAEHPAAEYGRQPGRWPTTVVPVAYQGEYVGRLVVEARSPEERFTRPERRLIADLARQVGAVVHAVALAEELQRSRERLVAAREEERRRLRRDLHDGIGPSLAGMRLQLRAVRAQLTAGGPRSRRSRRPASAPGAGQRPLA